jgi:hypothetical protein
MSRSKLIAAFLFACCAVTGLLVYRAQPKPLTPDRAHDAIRAWQSTRVPEPVELIGDDERIYYQIGEFRCDLERRQVTYYHSILRRSWVAYFTQDWLGHWCISATPDLSTDA